MTIRLQRSGLAWLSKAFAFVIEVASYGALAAIAALLIQWLLWGHS